MDDLVIRIGNGRFDDQVLQHMAVFDLGNAQDRVPDPVVFLHLGNDPGHVGEFLVVFRLGPLIGAVGKVLIIVLPLVMIRVKEILQVVETYDVSLAGALAVRRIGRKDQRQDQQ